MLPLFKGVAYATFFVRFLAMTFLITITSWASFYLFASMQSTLPWTKCDGDWNTVNCFTTELNQACMESPIVVTNPENNQTQTSKCLPYYYCMVRYVSTLIFLVSAHHLLEQ